MKKAVFAVLIILLLGGGVATWQAQPPREPVYKGKPLSWWVRSVYPADPDFKELSESSGPDGVRWLTWAVVHGHRPTPRWLAVLKSFPRFSTPKPDYYNEGAQALAVLGWWLCPVDERNRRECNFVGGFADWQVVRSLQHPGIKGPPLSEDELKQVVGALGKAFADADPVVRSYAAAIFGSCCSAYPDRPILKTLQPGFLKLLGDPQPSVRNSARWAICNFGPEASITVPQMQEMLHDSEPNMRARMAWSLTRVDPKERRFIPDLLILAKDPDWKCRVAAATALRQFGVKADAVIAELIQRLDDPDYQMRGNAMHALEEIGPPAIEAIPAILAALQKPDAYIDHYRIVSEFTRFAPDVVPYLIQALAHSNHSTREAAARTLGSQFFYAKATAEVIAALNTAANDPDEGVRSCAKFALKYIESGGRIPRYGPW